MDRRADLPPISLEEQRRLAADQKLENYLKGNFGNFYQTFSQQVIFDQRNEAVIGYRAINDVDPNSSTGQEFLKTLPYEALEDYINFAIVAEPLCALIQTRKARQLSSAEKTRGNELLERVRHPESIPDGGFPSLHPRLIPAYDHLEKLWEKTAAS